MKGKFGSKRARRTKSRLPKRVSRPERKLPSGNKSGGEKKGNTAALAEKIAARIGADTFEVVPADDGYPMDNYDKLTEMAKTEQAKKVRPQYAGPIPDPDAVRRRLHRSSGLVGRLTDEEFSGLIEYVLSL